MHDPQALLDSGEEAVARMCRRGHSLDLTTLGELTRLRRQTVDAVGRLRAESNQLARAGRDRGRSGGVAQADVRSRARELKERIQQTEAEHRLVSAELDDVLLAIPNLPADDIPDGNSAAEAVELYRVGAPPVFDFPARHHAEIGELTGVLDMRRAARLSGARFAVARGQGAALGRALAAFFLDVHTREHGYTEYAVPSLVSRETMTGTGQLPKFEQDLFRTRVGDRDLYLIPTGEVPLTSLHAGETLDAAELPLALTGHTPCFRSEAGSYGRDTRGILRLHEFAKVELVRICAPEQSEQELALLLGHAEELLRRLGLAYRVVVLPAGDIGFSARKTFDIEVWLPSQDDYREISSCSDCGTFQARRARIRIRDRHGATSFAATLNGSGLPVGRTVAAILEQYQRPDGSVTVPDVLVPYLGGQRLIEITPRT
ncbi:serine--tRNA ligase [Parafrankia colletiae]|uniref:Serine--tRNA ligase n=1 Tax=Parafrankia colletiae TaxID=573497 RepID=A0A1S1QJB4_9ACTN|nr:serine--tRNA ligase [Parafrankia colletiae]MCK9902337.1 serine--tRNA ligase [Frankia sp. Cpl3]OHV33152.1 serine--tRNA ligase [Parafrankia colletiae]